MTSYGYSKHRWETSALAALSATMLSLTVSILPAGAQTFDSADADTLNEIVVTAEKRESTVQKTPFSITAITGAQLSEQGLSTIEDVAMQTPSISVRSSGPGQTEYEMRGLTSSGGSSATVGLYLNDVPLSAPAAALNGKVTIDPDLFDLNRVEVLRGPQGTLYGSGSMGGTIKLVTNTPQLNKFEAAVQSTLSNTSNGGFNYGGSAMVNLPLIDDRLAVRIVGTDKYTDGWIDRVVLNPFPAGQPGTCGFIYCTRGNVTQAPAEQAIPRSNWERLEGGRGEVRFQPTDALVIDALLMTQSITMGSFSEADEPPGVDALTHYQPYSLGDPYKDTFTLYALTAAYEFPFATLTSATSRWSRASVWAGDYSETLALFGKSYFDYQVTSPQVYRNDDTSRQTSEELRLTSKGDGRVQWLLGGFYSTFTSTFSQFLADSDAAYLSFGGPAANPFGIWYQANNPYDIKQYAAFAEGSYHFADALKATVGLRWYKYDTSIDYEQSGIYSQTGNASQFTGQVASSSSGVNPKFNLSYEPNADLTLYAQIAKGFRPGGVNLPVPVPPCPFQVPLTYSPDSLWDYEIGEKTRLLGGRLTVNGDVYYIRWNNAQQQLEQACGYPFTNNVGTAISYGPELEITGQISHELSLSLNGTYTTAHVSKINSASEGLSIGPTQPLVTGLPLENVPRYTLNAAANYEYPISDRYQVTARLAANRIGPLHDVGYYFTELPAWTVFDARLGLIRGAFGAHVFADNLADKHAAITINTQAWSTASPTFNRAAVNTPRTVGVQLDYKF